MSLTLTNEHFWQERIDMAAAFRWTARLNMHEAIANHFSLAVGADRQKILINPNKRHFSAIRASDLLLLELDDPAVMERPDAPDPTAWGLHASVHRACPHARCIMHVHSTYATVLASLADSMLPPVDQNSAMFYGHIVVDDAYGGLALESEGERCANLLYNPEHWIMVMGNHGVMVIGETPAQTFDRLYYFERAAENYIKALWTGRPLRVMDNETAQKTADELDAYPDTSAAHLTELKSILDRDGADYAS